MAEAYRACSSGIHYKVGRTGHGRVSADGYYVKDHKLGHEVRLLSARMVKAFVSGNKNDAADARAIWTAVQQPGIKAVAVKSEGQQAVLALHRMRAQLVKSGSHRARPRRGRPISAGERRRRTFRRTSGARQSGVHRRGRTRRRRARVADFLAAETALERPLPEALLAGGPVRRRADAPRASAAALMGRCAIGATLSAAGSGGRGFLVDTWSVLSRYSRVLAYVRVPAPLCDLSHASPQKIAYH